MRPRRRASMDLHRPSPELLRACTSKRYRGGAVHARRLRRVGVEFGRGNDLHACCAPVVGRCCGGVGVGVVMLVLVLLLVR